MGVPAIRLLHDFGLSKKWADSAEYYMTSGEMVPVKWTAPEVCAVTLLAGCARLHIFDCT